jgi:hypothetical protein
MISVHWYGLILLVDLICWPQPPWLNCRDCHQFGRFVGNGVYTCPDLLASAPTGSIAETAINSVDLLGMVYIRALTCWPQPKLVQQLAGSSLRGATAHVALASQIGGVVHKMHGLLVHQLASSSCGYGQQ